MKKSTRLGCFAHSLETLSFILIVPWLVSNPFQIIISPNKFWLFCRSHSDLMTCDSTACFSRKLWSILCVRVWTSNTHAQVIPFIYACVRMVYILKLWLFSGLPIYTLVAIWFPNDIKFLTHIDPTSCCPSLRPGRSTCSS